MRCVLALEDGTVYTGRALGAEGTATGEVVFNTAHTGYQEILTDPSYCGQIVTMTFPLIGNYGVNSEDVESARPQLAGFVARELPPRPSNFRANAGFGELLRNYDIVGISDIDTRALTRRIRDAGAMRGLLSTEVATEVEAVRLAQSVAPMEGSNLVTRVRPINAAVWSERLWHADSGAGGFEPITTGAQETDLHVIALDCGIKLNILRHLADAGCKVTAAPSGWSADQVLALQPDAVLIGNGPGDPAAVADTKDTLRSLIGAVPVFGVCLGHQLLALALGATTYKLRFGHHGGNVPVRNELNGRVEITSQNHGFAVDADSVAKVGGEVTHVNLNDGSVEGLLHEERSVAALQFHPEASPGPHDSAYVFRRFVDAVRAGESLRSVFA